MEIASMKQAKIILTIFALLLVGIVIYAVAQTSRQRVASTPPTSSTKGKCAVAGAYRINVPDSDQLYSAVRDATSTVPFGDQQRFFMDLTVRLTPPDLIAIDCSGERVSVGSSRAQKVTFVADGKLRQERTNDGSLVRSRIALSGDTLTFSSTGKTEDNLNVEFRSIDGGRRLHVTRRIYAEQLNRPIVIQSIYDKLSDDVDWDVYGRQVAGTAGDMQQSGPVNAQPRRDSPSGATASDVRRALDEWIAATNNRDIARQMSFYMPQLEAFYLTRNTPVSAVRAEKNRAFQTARSIDIRAAEPEIVFQDGGRTAVMRFRKQYRIVDSSKTRSGEVVQELRWQRTANGWKIFSERDVRVIR